MLPAFLAALITTGVLLFIVYVVVTNNKWIASLLQQGSIQRREEVNAEIQQAKKSDDTRAREETTFSQRISFTVGMLNVWVTAFLLGHSPTLFYLWHTPKAVVLIALRWWDFKQRRQHYLLYDFCYWANGLLLLYLWVLPKNATLFQIVFMSSNGPLAWAALALHKWQHVTSVFLHASPMLVTYGIRWYDSAGVFAVCADYPACVSVGAWQALWVTLTRFYLIWIVFYYVWIFVYLGPYLQSRSFQTLYDRVAGQQARLLFQSNTVAPLHHLIKKGIYMMMHVLFGTATMTLASGILFHYQAAHLAFIICMTTMSAYNASGHYDAQFRTDTAELLKARAAK